MKPSARIQAAIELLEQLQQAWQEQRHAPMDTLMNQYFKSRRYVGAKDRGMIAGLVYEVLRHGGMLEWHLEQMNRAANPRRAVMAALILCRNLGWEEVNSLFSGQKYAPARLDDAERGSAQKLEDIDREDPAMPLSARYNFPDWLESRLLAQFGAQLPAAMQALNQEAPVDLRMNTLKCPSLSELILALDRDGILAAPAPHSPIGVRLQKRFAAFNTQAFKDGWFEMQDEGSQLVSLLVEAQPGEKVIDFCAGAGGKTLAIAASMKNKGRILALDVSESRLKQMPKRLARAGVNNVTIQPIRDEADSFLKRHKETADWVVVDAPCSGSGTWRRNPDLKWRFSEQDLSEIQALQARILQAAAKLVKPGGRLVYITCSLLQEENTGQINQFLRTDTRFTVATPGKLWNKFLNQADGNSCFLTLTPHQDGTDGFFAAVLTKHM